MQVSMAHRKRALSFYFFTLDSVHGVSVLCPSVTMKDKLPKATENDDLILCSEYLCGCILCHWGRILLLARTCSTPSSSSSASSYPLLLQFVRRLYSLPLLLLSPSCLMTWVLNDSILFSVSLCQRSTAKLSFPWGWRVRVVRRGWKVS